MGIPRNSLKAIRSSPLAFANVQLIMSMPPLQEYGFLTTAQCLCGIVQEAMKLNKRMPQSLLMISGSLRLLMLHVKRVEGGTFDLSAYLDQRRKS
jgi:hypothetical protein